MMKTRLIGGVVMTALVLLVVNRAGALANGRVDGYAHALFTGSAAQPVGTDVAIVPDMNGDGYDEIAIGGSAPNRVYVVLGGPDGWGLNFRLGTTPSVITYTGDNGGDLAGYGVAGVGDVNGDGFGDLLVGAPGHDLAGNNAGAIYVVLGSATLTSTNLGSFPIMIGEVAGDEAGRNVAPAGDTNGDGYQDMLVGVMTQDAAAANAGAVYLILGSAGIGNASLGSHIKYTGEAANDYAGSSADGIGDMNGDGYMDFVVGAAQNDAGISQGGSAYVVLGSAAPASGSLGTKIRYSSTISFNSAGQEVSGAGDFNGDGYADLMVSAPGTTPGVYLVLGSATPVNSTLGGAVFYSGTHGSNILAVLKYLAQAGDINGDGYGDVLIGSESDTTNTGAVYIAYGSANPTSATLSSLPKLTGAATGDLLGNGVRGNGDVNGDGLADIALNALSSDEGGVNAGGSYLILGETMAQSYQERQRLNSAGNLPAIQFAAPDVRVDFTGGALAGGDVTVTRHLFHPCATSKRLQTPIWTVDSPKMGSGATADLTFKYTDAQIAGMAEGSLRVFVRPAGEPCGEWTAVMGTVNANTNTITVSGLTSLGQFTLGVDAPSPTAVQELSAFGASVRQPPPAWLLALMALMVVTGVIAKYGLRYLVQVQAQQEERLVQQIVAELKRPSADGEQ
ncbi:MAG: FG-GAP repeat protein [Ardenticatenaceae bacterium]|nr:FG-GAP repeat protein [Ardenticatenaceae bacterium]